MASKFGAFSSGPDKSCARDFGKIRKLQARKSRSIFEFDVNGEAN